MVSTVFLLSVRGGKLAGGDDAADAAWMPMDKLPPMAFDHELIIKDALKLLKK